MDNTGEVDTFINFRGIGVGMKADWRSAGVTHSGLATFGVTNGNSVVKFRRMYRNSKICYDVKRFVITYFTSEAIIQAKRSLTTTKSDCYNY